MGKPEKGVSLPTFEEKLRRGRRLYPIKILNFKEIGTKKLKLFRIVEKEKLSLRPIWEMAPWLNWIEHLTTDQEVAGSNPAGVTRKGISNIENT